MHVSQSAYAQFEDQINSMDVLDEIKQQFFQIFKETLGNPNESRYSTEEYLKNKERVYKKNGESCSMAMKKAQQRYHEKNKERINENARKRYQQKKLEKMNETKHTDI